MNPKNIAGKLATVKNILGKKKEPSTACSICGLEFSDYERTIRHMKKAHTKPRKEKNF